MNLQSIYQIIYTVLFVLSGVLFASAVFVFFQFKILNVIEAMGIVRRGRRGGKKRVNSGNSKAVSEKPDKKRRKKSDEEEKTGPLTQSITTEGETLPKNREVSSPTEICKTEDMTSTAGLTGALTQSLTSVNEEARQKLEFRPGVKILVVQSMERI